MRVKANGIELNIEQSGKGQDVMFLPGLGGSTHFWYSQAQALENCARLTRVDPRGHGASDKPPGPYSVRLLAEDAEALISALELDRPVVVASSMSSQVAMELALMAPAQVGGLVLVGGYANLTDEHKERMEGRARLVETGGMAAVVDGAIGAAIGQVTHLTQPALVGLIKALMLTNDPVAYAASVRAIVAADLTDRIPGIRCPTLIVQGDGEMVAPFASARLLARAIPGARLRVIPDTGHLPFLEQPARFNAALLEFLGTL